VLEYSFPSFGEVIPEEALDEESLKELDPF
jgi:hypothetical protein